MNRRALFSLLTWEGFLFILSIGLLALLALINPDYMAPLYKWKYLPRAIIVFISGNLLIAWALNSARPSRDNRDFFPLRKGPHTIVRFIHLTMATIMGFLLLAAIVLIPAAIKFFGDDMPGSPARPQARDLYYNSNPDPVLSNTNQNEQVFKLAPNRP